MENDARAPARGPRSRRPVRDATAVGLVLLGTVAALSGLIRRSFWVVTVRGASMEPTLHAGDRVLVRHTRKFSRGDVVVLTPPSQAERVGDDTARGTVDAEWLLIKRVVATAGDPLPSQVPPGSGRVPLGSVVVQGDSDRSYDSRQWGPVTSASLHGKVVRQLGSGVGSR